MNFFAPDFGAPFNKGEGGGLQLSALLFPAIAMMLNGLVL
jgi:hypothetical protein